MVACKENIITLCMLKNGWMEMNVFLNVYVEFARIVHGWLGGPGDLTFSTL